MACLSPRMYILISRGEITAGVFEEWHGEKDVLSPSAWICAGQRLGWQVVMGNSAIQLKERLKSFRVSRANQRVRKVNIKEIKKREKLFSKYCELCPLLHQDL